MANQALTIRTIHPSESKRTSTVLYIDNDGRPGMTNIAADIAWRRTHTAPIKPAHLKELLIEQFPGLFNDAIKVTYSRYAGCSSCPCSPGYIIKNGNSNLEIWADMAMNKGENK